MIGKLLKKLMKSLLGSGHSHRHYSSSDYKKHNRYRSHNHHTYGKSHYKRKHSSHSFFSS